MSRAFSGMSCSGALLAAMASLPVAAVAGTIYVAEESLHSVNLYDQESHAFLGTLLGPSTTTVPVGAPYGMAQSAQGYVFVADAGGHQVLEFYNRALVQSIGMPGQQSIYDPQGVAIGPEGNLIVTNYSGEIFSYEFGGGYASAPTSSSLYSVLPGARAGATFNDAGELFVSDSLHGGAVYRVPAGGGNATLFTSGFLSYPFGNARGLAFLPDGDLLVADAGWEGTGLVYKADKQGNMVPFISNLGGADYIGVDNASQTIFITEFSANMISAYTFDGQFVAHVLTGLGHPGDMMVVNETLESPEPASWALGVLALIVPAWRSADRSPV